jgi:cytochrome b
MNNFGLILRNIVFFLFPAPFLLNFAIEHGGDWTAWVAYTAVVALVLGLWRQDNGSRTVEAARQKFEPLR